MDTWSIVSNWCHLHWESMPDMHVSLTLMEKDQCPLDKKLWACLPSGILYLTGSAFRFGKKHLIVHSECLDTELVEVYGNKFYLSLIILFLANLCRVIKLYKKYYTAQFYNWASQFEIISAHSEGSSTIIRLLCVNFVLASVLGLFDIFTCV